MRFALWPKSIIGRWAASLSLTSIILLWLSMRLDFGFGGFLLAALGLVGFVLGVVAFARKDRAAGTLLALLVGLAVLFVFGATWFMSLGLGKDFPVKASLTDAEAGTASTASVSLGSIAESDGWIYYLAENVIYRRSWNWTTRTIVAEVQANSLAVSDGWVYYHAAADGKLYRLRPDGSGRMMVADAQIESFTVQGDRLLYRSKSDPSGGQPGKDPSAPGAVYTAQADGSGAIRLDETDIAGPVPRLVGEWVYYCKGGDLWKVRIDGTGAGIVAEDAGVEHVLGDWIYYVTSREEQGGLATVTVSRLKLDGSERGDLSTLTRVYVSAFDGGWFYFGPGKGLSRLALDGTGTQQVNQVSVWGLTGVSGEWFYIEDYAGPRYRVKLDGSLGTRLN